MKLIIKSLIAFSLFFISSAGMAQTSSYKCMIQMNSYQGEKAYVIISLINRKGEYEKTLRVLGPDKQWFNTLKEWYKFQTKSKEKISAVTGASIGGGDRAVVTLAIDSKKLNAGYTLRFESAVEEKLYHTKDAEVPLTTAGLAAKTDGKGYIRYVRFSGS
ncbi:DUF2271 domain-containing protein [Niabella yanshanensis]|uniref:DUF2271 domain-containing protein n=1 Tax=Niabella yanshanensis TaxID=577386 RepID=A0ABZ0W366_9BACT|nr:DUF2271 domain-containing protein [Niabella yanshanensis]WQD36989.1 DUF2271 domain-containing protein [Niabella yanshanensis]